MSYVPTQPQADDFMLVDYKHVLDDDETPEAVASASGSSPPPPSWWSARRRGRIAKWQLFRRRYDIDSLRVQRAIDILDYGGFIARHPAD